MNRRKFIRRTALALGAAPFVKINLNAATNRPADIRIGIIGLGGMGRYHLDKLSKAAHVVAVCDVHEVRLHQAAAHARLNNGVFADYRTLLADKHVDAVVIATPDHWHARMTIDACEAGKDVHVETPAATNPTDGRKMVEAARRNKRIVQVGAHGRSNAGARKACEYLRNDQIGRIESVKCWITKDCEGMKVFQPRDPRTGPTVFELKSVAAAKEAASLGQADQNTTANSGQPPAGLNWRQWLGPLGERPYSIDLFENWRMHFDVGGGRLCGIGSQLLGLASWIMQVDETGPVRVEAKGGAAGSPTECPHDLAVTWTFEKPEWKLVWQQPHKQIGQLDRGLVFHGSNGGIKCLRRSQQCGSRTKSMGLEAGRW
ncbi:hypothetical protein GC207_00775 [bacterium]|nr:hypothetical protein [bacterium]